MVLNYAVVGYGPRSRGVMRALQGKMNLIAGFDPSEDAKEKLLAKNVNVPESYEDLLELDELDAVLIGSPPQFHAPQAIAALEHDLHVFSEVPMAIKEENVQKILDADESSPKAKYMLGENAAFHAEVIYAAHLVESGKLGPTVYCETEYLHDVSYRWRGRNISNYKQNEPKKHWYALFDPLMYAHAILPAQVAMGGYKNPMRFSEVFSYGNKIGGENGKPVCEPAFSFQVGLFKSKTGAIAKCASCYVFARKPTRYICQVVGRFGTYESYEKGGTGYQYMCDGFNISRGNRAGKGKKIRKWHLNKVANLLKGNTSRVVTEWVKCIEKGEKPVFDSSIAANVTMAGIASSESARTGKTVDIPTYD